jgi:hypothetical protein
LWCVFRGRRDHGASDRRTRPRDDFGVAVAHRHGGDRAPKISIKHCGVSASSGPRHVSFNPDSGHIAASREPRRGVSCCPPVFAQGRCERQSQRADLQELAPHNSRWRQGYAISTKLARVVATAARAPQAGCDRGFVAWRSTHAPLLSLKGRLHAYRRTLRNSFLTAMICGSKATSEIGSKSFTTSYLSG